jgi:HK97 family phage major capsid protein
MSKPLGDPAVIESLRKQERDIQAAFLMIAADHDRQADRRHNRRHVRAQIEHSVNPSSLLPTVSALTAHERRNYSVAALIGSLCEPRAPEGLSLEREISLSIAKDLKTVPQHGGVFVPLRISATGLDTKTPAAGGYLATPRGQDIIDALRSQTRILELGATFLTGLQYSQSFPLELAVSTAAWAVENAGSDVAASDSSFGSKTVTPHALESTTSISRQLLSQSNTDLEAWIRTRIAKAHAVAIDAAGINGAGVTEPLGLLKTAGLGDVPVGAAGGAPTSVHITALEAAVGSANADSDTSAFLTSPIMRQKLRNTVEIVGGSVPLWQAGTMLGYDADVTNLVPQTLVKGASTDCHAIIFGSWQTLLVAEFLGAIEILVDPYRLKKQGQVEVSSFGMYDTMLMNPGALAAIQDARNV